MKNWRRIGTTLAIILILIVPGSIASYYFFANPIAARVDIQPSVKTFQNASTLSIVTSQPDTARHQIAGARLLSATIRRTITQVATGQGYAQATSASGIIKMIAGMPIGGSVSESVGTTLTGSDGITIVSDQAATAYVDAGGVAYFQAHVSSPGSRGNIPAGGFYAVTSQGQWKAFFSNPAPFTGGQDAGPYVFVQQQDILAGEQTWSSKVKQDTLDLLDKSPSLSESWVQDPLCTTSSVSDETAGARARTFHLTISATCSGEVYDTRVVQAAATEELKAAANREMGQSYQLLGKIATTITSIQVSDQPQGALKISLTVKGTWIYTFTNEQKEHLAQMISGKSAGDAQKLLLQQPHIQRATITIFHGFWIWNDVPTDLKKIGITILS